MNVTEAIRLKRAIRHFNGQPLPEEATRTILNAGRRAQSSKNSQPWHFIAITDRVTLQAISECGMYASHLAGAALAVAIVHPDPGEKFQLLFDIGQAAAYMQLSAWELGIGSCIASIYDGDKARQILGFPADLHLRFALSFGYPQDAESMVRPPQKGGRRELSEIVHWNQW
ncbi:MAG: nitroreductase [Anaerolineales bacterium]|nr:nitroreductase [Anaerolineae bacterium]PWB53245.1 MAG: nitroreductase [Anaerolineales bacterium]